MTYAVVLGRDSWADFPTRTYEGVSKNTTAVTFSVREGGAADNAQKYSEWVNSAVGLVELCKGDTVVARFTGNPCRLPNAMSWVKIEITNTDGTQASDGMYYIRFHKGWLPWKAVVEAGASEIPLRHTGDQSYLLQPNMKLGVGGAPLVKIDLTKAKFLPTVSNTINAVEAAAP